jgi:O-methyltransferase
MDSERTELSHKEWKRQYRPRLLYLPPLDRPETSRQKLDRARRRVRNIIVPAVFAKAWNFVTAPAAVFFILASPAIHPSYGMTLRRKAQLALRMRRTTRKVVTGSSWRAHLAMAVKLLEIPPDVKGVVVECGSFQGGSTANLSLVCKIVGRELIVYDSFEGLPPPTPGDFVAHPFGTGFWAGSLETVQDHVRRYGAIDVCTFRKGWFADTLSLHTDPIVLCFLDVDYQASLHDCLTHLWPKLVPKGYLFLDDFVFLELSALFWSERYWKTYFGTTPPGLIGSGAGLALGNFYLGPFQERRMAHSVASVAYARKDLSGVWDFFPDDSAPSAHAT